MPFVNEYVSDENVQKYDLNNVWNKYNYFGADMPKRLSGYKVPKHSWCVDKVREYWLFQFSTLMSHDSRSGYSEPSNNHLYILHVDGQNIEVILTSKGLETSELNPIYYVRDMVSMTPNSLPNMSEDSLVIILKEALSV